MEIFIKRSLISLLPSFILGVGFDFLISLLGGMETIKEISAARIFIGFILFMYIFVQKQRGKNIFAHFLKYAAYECWLLPFCIIIYTITSMSQVHEQLGDIGAFGAGMGGSLLILVSGIGSGLLGLVLYLIANTIIKNNPMYKVNSEENYNQLSSDDREIMKKNNFWRYVSIIFFVCLISVLIKKNEKSEINTSSTNILKKGYTLNAAELVILDAILQDDAKIFMTGGKSFIGSKLIITTPQKVAEDYNQNQVSANQKYQDKELFLSGRIQDIRSGIGEGPYLLFRGINPFFSPAAHFQNDNIKRIASLKKGQEINIVCKSEGAIIETPQ